MRKKLCLILGAAALFASTPGSAAPKGDEPVAVPRAIKQGIDFVYVDPQMSSVAKRKQKPQNWLQRIFNPGASRRGAPNPMFDQLSRGLQQYQATLGTLAADQDPGRRDVEARLHRQARGAAPLPPRPGGKRRL